ncbi:MAG: hypothetical protein M9894_29890 [Planctomycetes bacterium]|nr:hypothetical protein [Planctomycetota bacterium]
MNDGAEGPVTRDDVRAAALRGGVAAVVGLWIFALVLASEAPAGAAPLGGGLVLAAALAVVLRRAAQGRWLTAALAAVLILAPVGAVARVAPAQVVLVAAVGALAAGVVVGVVTALERAALRRAVRLRARALAAAALAAVVLAGGGAAALQVVAAWGVLEAGSPAAGYDAAWTAVTRQDPLRLLRAALVAGPVAAVLWARLRHPDLGRQLRSVLLLGWPLPACAPIVSASLVWHEVTEALLWTAGLAVIGGLGVLVALRQCEALEGRLLGVERLSPRPAPPGSERRSRAAVLLAALALLTAHAGASTWAAWRLARVRADLRAREEPLDPADLGPPPDEAQDGYSCYRRAAELVRAIGPFNTKDWRGVGPPPSELEARLRARSLAVATRRFEQTDRAWELIREGARRPACRWPVDTSGFDVLSELHNLLEGRINFDLVHGRADDAAEGIQLLHGLWDAAEPELAYPAWRWSRGAAVRHAGYLLRHEHRDPSPDTCRRLARTFGAPVPRSSLRRMVRGVRVRLDDTEGTYVWTPLLARLGWVRDLDRAQALEAVQPVLDILEPPPAGPRLGPPPPDAAVTWRPLTLHARADAYVAVAWFEELESERRLLHLALLLRAHRLEVGAYPADLSALVALGELDAAPMDITYRTAGEGFVLIDPSGRSIESPR